MSDREYMALGNTTDLRDPKFYQSWVDQGNAEGAGFASASISSKKDPLSCPLQVLSMTERMRYAC
jgi:hypothetical protein